MGLAVPGVVDGPRAADLLHLLLPRTLRNARLVGHLHHHRSVLFTLPLATLLLNRPADSKGRLLDPATFDFADEGAATEMHDIPITLVNRALYGRG
jgi:hypothetical protein